MIGMAINIGWVLMPAAIIIYVALATYRETQALAAKQRVDEMKFEQETTELFSNKNSAEKND